MNDVTSNLAKRALGGSLAMEAAFDAAENAFLQWKWDGATIEDIQARGKAFGMTMTNMVESYPEKIREWAATVPTEYQGRVRGASGDDPSQGENSLASIEYYAEILAFDQQGKALVEKSSVNSYTDADSTNVLVMSHQEAIQLINHYREEHRLAEDPDAELSTMFRM